VVVGLQRDETILLPGEDVLNTTSAIKASIKQRGSVMLAYIISLFYRRACKQYLTAMRNQQRRWNVATAG
jgi:hypothetical protein